MDAVEDIKGRVALEDVVGEYLELKRAGRNLRGLSPFTNERTPSLMVSPEKQIWHDFSSGKGGNMFSWVMEMEGVDFRGALEILARKAGLDLSQYNSQVDTGRSKQKQHLYTCLELATKFYQVQFSKNKAALEYVLHKRGYTKDTALAFRLGYAPNTGRALTDFLKKKGFSEKDIQQAGLATARYQMVSDMFRGRLMVPLMDSQGRVIGFTARLMDSEDNGPKYINTPQTMLYDKSRHVFGLHLAKEAIRKSKFAVVVEGNLDVIASYQAGVANVVATAGTALTLLHLKELKRFTPDIRLSFDQDNAGLAAAERSIPLANTAGVSLSIITVPEGKDPDELIQKDPELWKQAIEHKQYALDWLIDRHKQLVDSSSAQGKRALTDAVLPLVRQLHDSVEQDHYLERLASELGVSKEALASKLRDQKQDNRPKKKGQPTQVDPRQADLAKAQNQLLALCLVQPSLRPMLEFLREEMFADQPARELLRFIRQHLDTPPEAVAKELKGSSDYIKIMVLLYEELYSLLEYIELQYEAARLQVRVIEQYVKSQKTTIVEQLTGADEATTQTLLEEAKKLDILLKTAKEPTRGK